MYVYRERESWKYKWWRVCVHIGPMPYCEDEGAPAQLRVPLINSLGLVVCCWNTFANAKRLLYVGALRTFMDARCMMCLKRLRLLPRPATHIVCMCELDCPEWP